MEEKEVVIETELGKVTLIPVKEPVKKEDFVKISDKWLVASLPDSDDVFAFMKDGLLKDDVYYVAVAFTVDKYKSDDEVMHGMRDLEQGILQVLNRSIINKILKQKGKYGKYRLMLDKNPPEWILNDLPKEIQK